MIYKIIETSSVRAMTYEVGKALDSNWKPIGGVCVIVQDSELNSSPVTLYQAMIKKTRSDNAGGPGSYF